MGAILTRNRESRTYSRLLRSILMIRSRNICSKCNIHFKTKMRLDEHMQRYHAEATYTCNHCNLICETWRTFQEHIYARHNAMVFCSYCYKAYSDYSSLLLHWKTHEPFECEICNDTFVTLADLREHHAALHRNVPFQRRLSFFRRFTG
ncbi:oocyte zinc finger protein XlCOF6-like [Temnothorax curvispinosus]|uniref:Oocyte zinc finger protein XlCOF6-like n=1 Tax=Temnothorax curvispinosus TaxID=300111 RepID=A0A6J1QNP4_9HYME|nr:oocyte zinc finger protein XlCOF6-like [Temnothorax curvispinosus]